MNDNIKICVISDTHGNVSNAINFINNHGPFDILLHAGDHLSDLYKIKKEIKHDIDGYYGVVGNCDDFFSPDVLTITELDIKIILLHGDDVGVKKNLLQLNYLAEEKGADLVVFGHTHIATNVTNEGVLFFNPGSASLPRDGGEPSFGVIKLRKGEAPIAKIIRGCYGA
ncbi:YfcE family phosphodiesterase [Natranaerobius trueperi]|uniref:Phosphoesterase n=1 Tax=Natranaerobius trueperi TaxID=759412 RepID=A0A226BXI5_9FIRM|nr:metallophosphoesterase [Natranaerobius trueperi]OWZ83743.1 YfcE family phosphodiesterase [Natranaerobius trueperi]